LTFNALHGVNSQKTEFSIITAVRTPNTAGQNSDVSMKLILAVDSCLASQGAEISKIHTLMAQADTGRHDRDICRTYKLQMTERVKTELPH
jgi:hypothetical protein